MTSDRVVSPLRSVRHRSPAGRRLARELIEDHHDVAVSMAWRYRNRGVDLDDLQQVALLGLTKAAQRFDPDAGHAFMSFAVPTIRGEIRRYFRDNGWMVRPPRRVQELQPRIHEAREELERELERSPRPTEIAEHLGEPLDSVVEALTAEGTFAPTSLDGVVGDGSTTLGELLGGADPALRAVEAKVLVQPLLAQLSERDRHVVRLRFYEDRPQREIADDLGITQAQVSRILARLLAQLRRGLEGEPTATLATRCATHSTPMTRAS
ncbi:SigB/SigF/SigG family RNA polymerase sigma factor [Nocardioides sp. zg-1308]|uniref:SigB/SigF/SigG family RNA polymerase sigma factor n=1 Tax=Nocardioides TaxID=1839 RepID=UPI001557B7DB|nr:MULTISPECIES: SigB/SigF/SigG family RNA polymerase sigma factor [unclassified Nocardioides]NPD06042.1 SigB/SigF/SigG family RNA polymerase sigma factor [Nocardioides sp. zg-1308]WQQ20425.1 SigB/SigF/SigG family RNA polymerase sigma factor [Nocardioides sp. S-34]